MQLGNRVIYDQDGEVITQLNELSGHVVARKAITTLNYIDIEYGSINYMTHRIVGINTETLEPILEELPDYETEEQKLIRELEDALLLATDAETGGIL